MIHPDAGGSDAHALAAEYARLLASAVTTVGALLRDAQLPLHILLASPFGSLNENQEEILGAAQSALETADSELRALARLLELDRGTASRHAQRIGVAALVQPAIAMARARAGPMRAAAHFTTDVPESLPRVVVDPAHVSEALAALFTDTVSRLASPGASTLSLAAREHGADALALTVSPHRPAADDSLAVRLARRLIVAERGEVLDENGVRTIVLPTEAIVFERAAGKAAPSAVR